MSTSGFEHVKPGDKLLRLISSARIPSEVIVTKVDDDLIYAGVTSHPVTLDPEQGWTFDRATGIEVDELLGFGPKYGISGSWISRVLE